MQVGRGPSGLGHFGLKQRQSNLEIRNSHSIPIDDISWKTQIPYAIHDFAVVRLTKDKAPLAWAEFEIKIE